jgi:cystathionine beta-lyase
VTPDFDALTLPELQQRQSVKWRLHPADVLPMWVAELDVPLAAPVQAVLRAALDAHDTGYAEPAALAPAFAGFAARRWGWTVDPERCWPVADVMVGVAEALRALTAPGDAVVVCPPVYHPFFAVPVEHDRTVVQVPLDDAGGLDLPGIDATLHAGARAVLLSSPHNPTGRVWSSGELDALDDVVRPHGAVVISDEIHAPLTLPGATFTPYLAAGERRAVTVASASKAFNLAGLKAALLVAGDEQVQDRLAAMPVEVAYRVGHLGALASTAAYDDGDAWLAALLAHLDRNRRLLGALLAELLPEVGYAPPQASYLAWLDCRALTDEPAAQALERGRVALIEGTVFGAAGAGHARLNFGTTSAVLTEGVQRLAHGLRG